MTNSRCLRTLLLVITVTFVAATAYASGGQGSSPPKTKPSQNKFARKTTDPPTMPRGNKGQDLFLAVNHRDAAAVQALLKQGADPNSRNGLEFTPLDVAAASHQTDVMETLLQSGAKVDAPSPYGTALTFAALGGNVEGIDLLLAKGADINASRADGITVLMLASRTGADKVVQELIRRKADVNARDHSGATALTYAAREGQKEAGQVLLAAGAGVDGADNYGWTPLMSAAVTGHTDFVRLLLEKGAHPNAKDAKGRTALLLTAAYGDHPDVVRTLLAGGADAQATNRAGHTAASLAAARGHKECLALLSNSAVNAPAGNPSIPRDATAAVKLSLTALQSSMLQFSQRTGCVSCHQEGLGRMATGAARDHGFLLSPEIERMQTERINGMMTALQPVHLRALKDPEAMKQVPLIEIEEVAASDTWILAGMAAHKQPSSEANGAMAMVLARQQLPDGHWQFSGPRVPMQSSFFTMTALSVQSLRAYGPRAYGADIAKRIAMAKAWLMQAPTQTSEDRASRLLGLKWAGTTEAERQKAIDDVRADQRPDGGWSQLPSLQSDAYATGQALYALHVVGELPVTDPVYTRGVQFLLINQDEDGSWFVNKRATPNNNYFDAGFPHGQSQYASFNGTCWAIMALAQTIERPRQQASVRTP